VRLANQFFVRTRDAEVAGRMAWTLGYTLLHLGRYEDAHTLAHEAQRKEGLTPAWTARLQAMQAMALNDCGRLAEADAVAQRAKAAGERAGDPVAVGYALHVYSRTLETVKHDEEASLAAQEQALTVIGDGPETTDLRLLLLGNRWVSLQSLGRTAEADRSISRALVLAEQVGTPLRLARIRTQAA